MPQVKSHIQVTIDTNPSIKIDTTGFDLERDFNAEVTPIRWPVSAVTGVVVKEDTDMLILTTAEGSKLSFDFNEKIVIELFQ